MSEVEEVQAASSEKTQEGIPAWEHKIAQKLNATPYPERKEGSEIDKIAFNLGLVSVLKAMHRGELEKNIVQVTHDAFGEMVKYWEELEAKKSPRPGMGKRIFTLSTSTTGQLLCATIYQLTQGSLKHDQILDKAKMISRGENTEVAQKELLEETSKAEDVPFQVRWFAESAALLDELQAENVTEKGKRKYFFAPVSYEPVPEVSELKKKFGFCDVTDIFDGRPFVLHEECQGMDKTEGMRIMCLKTGANQHVNGTFISEEAVKKTSFAKNGFRPGTQHDVLGFSRVDPEKSGKKAVVALGASAVNGAANFFPVVAGEPPYYSLKSRASEGISAAFSALFIAK